jgi:pyridoxamine 5'-phosphate oxidase
MPASPSAGWPDARPGNTESPADPLARVREWYDHAAGAFLAEPNSMALATASPDGVPSVRIVLLKGIDDRGIRFFTNYESRKGRELDANPRAAVVLYWQPLHRQVRMEGPVERLTAEESDAYFATRDRGSRLGAWASRQGSVIPGRETLDAALADAAARYPEPVPRPDYWGGYRLVPDAIELWEGRPNRLHDRVHFLREPDGTWRSERLSP